MNGPENRLRAIFADALEIEDTALRAEYLAAACGANAALRREVEELLQANHAAPQFLPERPGSAPVPAALLGVRDGFDSNPAPAGARVAEQPGDRIGRYRLLRRIGEGGCGVVYGAEQEEPVRRDVALKVIKLGMDTKQVVARFEAERQALARMDHPQIAKVLDAGATETGRPYFVMELVRGIRITDYCEQKALPVRDRLELFIGVCHAVQHAHQKGIIHRDLKPSNVLVTETDGAAVPKVIDFGIAKATDGRLADQTVFTALDQFLGTPAYMSPEQAALSSADIDTRSDIYSLGVLLYELLTGTTPFDTAALLAVGLDEVRRTIREETPPRPSMRLTQIPRAARSRHSTGPAPTGNSPSSVARGVSRRQLQEVRGDLDWIVMKCLEKDPDRRYATANGLATDLRRHLNHEPVVARPPSRLYEFRKTVRRHKLGFAAATTVGMALGVGLLVSTLELARARRAEREQTRLQQQAEQEADHARRAEAETLTKLRDSFLAQAQAGRWSHRAGRRLEGLELLAKAAAIRPDLDLRNEAIACLALTDLRKDREWQALPEDTEVAFDPGGERYAFGDAHGTVQLCRVGDAQQLTTFPGYTPPFWHFEFSPDGRFLSFACGIEREHTAVLDLENRKSWLRVNEPRFRALGFTPDARLLAVAYEIPEQNWPIHIFDLGSKRERASFGHGTLPYSMSFHPTRSRELLTSDQSPTVRLWDWQTGTVIRSFEHPDRVMGLAWHPDGSTFATGCADNQVYLWDAVTGKQRGVLSGHESVPFRQGFSARGEFLVSAGWDGSFRLWDPSTMRETVSLPLGGTFYGFSRGADRFGVSLGAGKLGIVEVSAADGYCALRSRLAPEEGSISCDFSPDARRLLCTDPTGMSVWDLGTRREIGRVTHPPANNHFAFFHPDGTNIFLASVSGVEDWVVPQASPDRLWPLALRRTFPLSLGYNPLALSRDGRTLAVGAGDGLHLFDSATGLETARMQPGYPEIFPALSPDGRQVATWTRLGRSVQIWDVAHSNLVQELPAGDVSIQAAFNPNNETILVGDGVQYCAWDRRTWQSLYLIPRTAASSWARMAFSPDGALAALAITRSTLRLVEAATGREVATLEAPERRNIGWLCFSPDGSQLAVATAPGSLQLWNLGRIRERLAAMNLDWAPPTSAAPATPSVPK